MLYLIKQPAYDENGNYVDILKIGYTDNLNQRLRGYTNSCPSTRVISVREGDEFLEKFLHIYFGKYKYPKLVEWFYYSEDIVIEFCLVNFNKEFCDKIQDKSRLNKLLLKKQNSEYLEKFKSFGREESESISKLLSDDPDFESFEEMLTYINSLDRFKNRMETLISYLQEHPNDQDKVPDEYKDYFDNIPLETLLEGCSRKDALDKKLSGVLLEKSKSDTEVASLVYAAFQVNMSYTKKEIKTTLSQLYDQFGLKAKAVDILNYFEVSRVQIKNKLSRKYDEGYRLLSKKL